FLLCCMPVSLLTLPTAAQDRITIMSYNVENMFDVFDDPYTEDDGTRVKPREEYERIAALIRAYDPDVIAVVEVENEWVLRAMVKEILGGSGYDHIAMLSTKSGRCGNMGMISRRPTVSLTSQRFAKLTLPGEPSPW